MRENDKGPLDDRSLETTPMTSSERRSPSRESGRHGRFIPGMHFGTRYRIAGLLGRGGMGEVYAADDLELGQTVALKFLPERMTRDESALGALRNEVRVARQISHPNVCRVYDIGEVEGQHFVTMEYVDGEDLAGLLRRIGRLPREKATDIVRQLAAGLTAAHELGVLHRDLKPANVMIDGRGRVHIMDFGLAGFAEDLRETRQQAGTLTYMAPEQLAGKGPSMRSDVYSLGLVMYEILTGRRPYDVASADELRERQASAPPSNPSVLVTDCDSAVERVVMRCLEFDPERRPFSALAVAAALPGGDPLAAALAAGETPSPEMVAAAGGRGVLRPSIGAGLLGATLISFVAVALLNDEVTLLRLAHLEKPPVVLADRAREILAQLGYPDRPTDVAYGFATGGLLSHVGARDQSIHRWKNLNAWRPTPYEFWYRQSNAPMIPWNRTYGRVGPQDPPLVYDGMFRIWLDQTGRLNSFIRVPPLRWAPADTTRPVDWTRFFSVAQLDPGTFHDVAPTLNPPVSTGERRAWEGYYPGADSVPVRIEAGASNGAPAYFRLVDTDVRQWLLADPAAPEENQSKPRNLLPIMQRYVATVTLPVLVFIPALIAWRNIRARRGDLRSALRFAAFVFALSFLYEALTRAHYPDLRREMNFFLPGITKAIGYGILLGLCYLAAEPHLRKQWPDLLISWTRLITGRFRDPLVGRDLLIGSAAGAVTVTLYQASLLLPTWFGHPMRWPRLVDAGTLLSGRVALGAFLEPSFVIQAMSGVVLIMILLAVLRRKLPAIAAAYVIMAIGLTDADLTSISDPAQQAVLVADILTTACAFFVAIRFGLLALLAFAFFYYRLMAFPVTLDMSAWYATTSSLVLVALSAITLFAFRISTRSHAARHS